MEARLQPVAEPQRILALDVLRGFAVLGILAMNVGSFSMPAATYFDPTAYGDLTGANRAAWTVTHLLADLKFMAIFSMLFGAGIVLMTERAESRGRSATGLHYRRMGWLIVFGLLHAHLLWYNDILYWYGVIGLLAYLFRKLPPRRLIFWGVASIAVTSLLMLAGGLTTDRWPPEMLEYIVRDLKPPPEALAAEVEAYRGGWLEQMEYRVPKALEMELNTLFVWALWRVGGLMLLGMALFKLGVFSAERSAVFYRRLVAVAILIGIPLIAYGIHLNFAADWEAPYFFFIGLQLNYWGSLPVSLGWVGLVMLACRKPGFGWFTGPLAAVGRMAFTNYILQTVICTTIFYGHGLGQFGQVERTGQAAIVVGVWAFQLIASPIWLRHFRYGPLEWLWRSLVYLSPPPFRRTAV